MLTGLLTSCRTIITKTKREMAAAILEDVVALFHWWPFHREIMQRLPLI